jgi:hypothetical protein
MAIYSVRWDIEVDAANPEDAARQALRIQRDTNSLATSFEVFAMDGTGACTPVDLPVNPPGWQEVDGVQLPPIDWAERDADTINARRDHAHDLRKNGEA